MERPDKSIRDPDLRRSRLLNSKSTYLRDAALQPVNWFPYCKEAFEEAQEKDKPILIDVGASWCHWCHVMDEESYSDPEIAKFLNEHFVCVKVDRDEMPAIDRKYQEAIATITGQGGWPLTVFALPSGEVFYGGTYFPKEERFGKPPFLAVLKAVLRSYREEKEKTKELASQITQHVEKKLEMEYPSELTHEILTKGLDSVLRMGDPVYGGFGFSQKFPMPTAVRFLLSSQSKFDDAIKFADHTLEEMYAGGIRDHIFGGFFRYTIDRDWTIPHFEKISYDNGELMINYSIAYRNTRRKIFKECVEDIIEFLETFMASGDGYYTSIDADFRGEEGGFYTFLYEEIKEALNDEEFKALKLLYGITKDGNFNGKNHLRIDASIASVAEELKLELEELREIVQSAKNKLRRLRIEFKSDLNIDKNIYTGYNSIIYSGLIYSGLTLDDGELIKKGISGVDKLFKRRFGDILNRREDLEGLLEDYAFLISSLINCYTASLDQSYLGKAEEVMNVAFKEFYRNGKFMEKEGVVTIYDLSYRSPLSQMIENLTALGVLRDNNPRDSKYLEIAEKLLKKYAGMDHGLFDAGYLLAIQSYLNPIVVEADEAELHRLRRYINHNTFFKVGKGSICIGERCIIAGNYEKMEAILKRELNVKI